MSEHAIISRDQRIEELKRELEASRNVARKLRQLAHENWSDRSLAPLYEIEEMMSWLQP